MQQFAQELVDLHLDLILSHNTPTTAALLRHTRTIPIVFAVVAKAQPSRRALLLSSTGKQLAAVCRINALWRLRCCALPVCGFGGRGLGKTQISTPVPSAPGFPELRRVRARQLRLLSLMGNSLPPCVASTPCGVYIVARCLFADSGRVTVRQGPSFISRTVTHRRVDRRYS